MKSLIASGRKEAFTKPIYWAKNRQFTKIDRKRREYKRAGHKGYKGYKGYAGYKGEQTDKRAKDKINIGPIRTAARERNDQVRKQTDSKDEKRQSHARYESTAKQQRAGIANQ